MTLAWLRAMRLKTWPLMATPVGLAVLVGVLSIGVATVLTVVPRGSGIPRTSMPGTLQPGRRPAQPMPPASADAAAAQFLAQTTFGPTLTDIARVRQLGKQGWLDEQFAATPSYQLPYLDALGADIVYDLGHRARMEAWFLHALGGPDPLRPGVVHRDQLRQRVAFALSEIFVVSEQNSVLSGQFDSLADYYDVLARNAFGNYRQLLEEVALHPAMGVYLSMQGNRKEDLATGIRPDENFAREAMQLLSVGLVQLNPDGTPMHDGNGREIPTYDQFTVQGFARVYTGWSLAGCEATQFEWCWFYDHDAPAWRTPMAPYATQHDSSNSKQLLRYPGVALPDGLLPAGGTARSDLKAALDNLFNHPNVGPFIARQLIQRLVTSNPDPAYVARVAQAFNDNGIGVRGDLKATIAAIVLDRAAANTWRVSGSFGKVREPILRLTHGWRALDGHTRTGRMSEYQPEWYLGQAPLRAASVFSFFRPDYTPTGELSALGLASPELQLATDSMMPATQNAFGEEIFHYYVGNPDVGPDDISVDLARDMPLAANPAALLARYDLLFLSGQMSPAMRSILLQRLNGMPNANNGRDRVQEALYLIVNSPEYVVQK